MTAVARNAANLLPSTFVAAKMGANARNANANVVKFANARSASAANLS